MVTVSCPEVSGGNTVRMMVRHMDDDTLVKHPHIKMEQGAWDYVQAKQADEDVAPRKGQGRWPKKEPVATE